MLITIRNSGAESITHTPKLENKLLIEILHTLDKPDTNHHSYDMFLEGSNIESFVIDKSTKPLLHLMVTGDEWVGDNSKHYKILLETEKDKYIFHYPINNKPDFFKRLFKYFYPEDADKQVEELV